MSDLLDMEKINSLGHTVVEMRGSKYDLERVCVETGLARIDVCGMIDLVMWSDFDKIIDGDLNEHDPDDFYLE